MSLKNLRLFNFVMGCFHLIQAVLMLLLSNDFKAPVVTSFLDATNGFSSIPQPEEVFRVQVGPFVALFLLVSAIAHFLLSAPKIYEWYQANLKKGMNPARWYEYSVSSSIMIVIIGMLCGIYELGTLILLFSLNACMIFFGHVMELHNQTTKKIDWTSFVYGCFAGIVPWIVIAVYFIGAASKVGGIPEFVYGILISLFLFFNVFAINMFLQYKKIGPWKNYLFGERMYIVLSLLAKSALAWQVFSGTIR